MQYGGRSMRGRPTRRRHARRNSSGESRRDAEGEQEIQAPALGPLQLSIRVLSLSDAVDLRHVTMRCSARAVRDF